MYIMSIYLGCFFVGDLGSKIEFQASEIFYSVFNDQGCIIGHGEDDLVGQVGGFIEQVEVSKGERKTDGLVNFKNSLFFLLFRVVGLDGDATSTDFSTNRELDRFLRGFNID